eukprot:scaffold9476_cov14-Tisochrysis_lutea.AAC.1
MQFLRLTPESTLKGVLESLRCQPRMTPGQLMLNRLCGYTLMFPTQGSETLQFESIVNSYLNRNYSTTFVDRYPVWK